MHTRVVRVDTSDGSAAGTVGVPPTRYAGCYYRFDDDTDTANITITNLGQTVFTKAGANNSDGIQDVLWDDMPVVADELVVGVNPLVGDGICEVKIFLEYVA